MGENLSRRDENGPKLRPKIICYITRKVKNGLICGQNKNGRFWWKQLETAPTYVIIFKRVETYCGGMKMGAWVKMMKIMCNSSQKAKKWDSGCSKKNRRFWWKQLDTVPTWWKRDVEGWKWPKIVCYSISIFTTNLSKVYPKVGDCSVGNRRT